MINKIINALILTAFLFIGLLALVPNAASAVDTSGAISCGVNSAASGDCNKQAPSDLSPTITNVINLLSAAVGLISVIMIIIAGLRLASSSGNPEAVKSARNTIVYAVIGLVIVSMAQIIVHFVLHKVG